MTVYVEFVIIDNFVIDLLILLLTKTLLKIQTKKILLFIATTFGTIVAVVSPLLPNIISQVIKIPLALSMVLIAFRPKTLKEFLAQTLTFLISTFVMIGCCLVISQIFKIEVSVQNGMIMEKKGFNKIKQRWLDLAQNLGETISVHLPNQEIEGVFKGIDDQGALILKTKDGVLKVMAGDVFLI